MEIRLLRYAVEVYRKQSFTKAAEDLHIAQPSLSQQIAKLELELGVRLFLRNRGKVTVTPEGERFVKQATIILQMHEDLEREMKERSQGMGRDLVIGTTAITGGRVLPPLIQRFEEKFPEVRLKLVEETTKKLVDLTANGQVDLSLLALPIEENCLSVETIITEPLFLAIPRVVKGWMSKRVQEVIRFADRPFLQVSFPLHEFAKAPFILLKKGFGFRQTLLELCAESSFQPKIAYETSSIETAQSLVAFGLGVTLVPKMVTTRYQDNQSSPFYLPLDTNPSRTIGLAFHRERYLTLAAKAFLSIAKSYAFKF